MERRNFLQSLCALPFLRWMKPKRKPAPLPLHRTVEVLEKAIGVTPVKATTIAGQRIANGTQHHIWPELVATKCEFRRDPQVGPIYRVTFERLS